MKNRFCFKDVPLIFTLNTTGAQYIFFAEKLVENSKMLAALCCLLNVITFVKKKKNSVNIEGIVIVLCWLKDISFLAFRLPVQMLHFRKWPKYFTTWKEYMTLNLDQVAVINSLKKSINKGGLNSFV